MVSKQCQQKLFDCLLWIFESFFPPISFISLAPLLEAQGLGLDRIEGGGEEVKGAMAE